MDFIKKLQKQPEHIRKMILWSVVIIIGLGLIIWWIDRSYRKIKEFDKEGFIERLNIDVLEDQLQDLPKIEMPQEELKRLEEKIRKLEEATKDAGQQQIKEQ